MAVKCDLYETDYWLTKIMLVDDVTSEIVISMVTPLIRRDANYRRRTLKV